MGHLPLHRAASLWATDRRPHNSHVCVEVERLRVATCLTPEAICLHHFCRLGKPEWDIFTPLGSNDGNNTDLDDSRCDSLSCVSTPGRRGDRFDGNQVNREGATCVQQDVGPHPWSTLRGWQESLQQQCHE